MIDNSIPTSGLLAHVLVAKFGDHLPLYRKVLDPLDRQRIRQARAGPIIDELYHWLIDQRQRMPKGSATSKVQTFLKLSLYRYELVSRFL